MRCKTKYVVITLVLSLICMGVGSFAWFTATFKVNSNLKITTGTVKFEIEDETWTLETPNNSELIPKDFNGFKNLKVGNIFIKKITIRNTGSLKQRLIFNKNNNLPNEISDAFEIITFTKTDPLDEMIIKTNQTRSILIKLILKNSQTGDVNRDIPIDFSKLKNVTFGTIDVTQVD